MDETQFQLNPTGSINSKSSKTRYYIWSLVIIAVLAVACFVFTQTSLLLFKNNDNSSNLEESKEIIYYTKGKDVSRIIDTWVSLPWGEGESLKKVSKPEPYTHKTGAPGFKIIVVRSVYHYDKEVWTDLDPYPVLFLEGGYGVPELYFKTVSPIYNLLPTSDFSFINQYLAYFIKDKLKETSFPIAMVDEYVGVKNFESFYLKIKCDEGLRVYYPYINPDNSINDNDLCGKNMQLNPDSGPFFNESIGKDALNKFGEDKIFYVINGGDDKNVSVYFTLVAKNNSSESFEDTNAITLQQGPNGTEWVIDNNY